MDLVEQGKNTHMSASLYFLRNARFVKLPFRVVPSVLFIPRKQAYYRNVFAFVSGFGRSWEQVLAG